MLYWCSQVIALKAAAAGNQAPVITSNGGGATAAISLPENTTPVTTVTATDPDAGTTLTYSIIGGADSTKFLINPATGALSFNISLFVPDFEVPNDADLNNIYEVTVQVSDGALTDTQAISVTITNVAEATDNIGRGGGENNNAWSESPPTPSLTPANTRVVTAFVSQTQVSTGQPVTIIANVANRGDITGPYTVTLMINGKVAEVKTGSLEGNLARPLQFTYVATEPGQYEVDVNGVKAYFTTVGQSSSQPVVTESGSPPAVEQSSSQPSGRLPIFIIISVVVIAIILGLLFFMRRRSYNRY